MFRKQGVNATREMAFYFGYVTVKFGKMQSNFLNIVVPIGIIINTINNHPIIPIQPHTFLKLWSLIKPQDT